MGSLAEGRISGLPRALRGLTVAEIAKLTGAELAPGQPTDGSVRNIASLDAAGGTDIAFLDDEKDLADLASTHAAACLMPRRFATFAPSGVRALFTEQPYRAFVAVARALFPEALRLSSPFEAEARAAAAQVHPLARLEPGVIVDPLAVIGPRAQIGAGTLVAACATIGADVCVGRQCAVGAGATITHALIGDRVLIQSGARIGQDGFARLAAGQKCEKMPSARRVIIQNDVEIGANVTIDRGSLRDTIVGEGTRIDNLVQIAHSVMIGRHCLLGAQAGVAASVTIGDFVTIGGQVGIASGVTINDGATLASRGIVQADVSERA